MSHREFVDPAGLEWEVYDVLPRADERRHDARRASGDGASEGGATADGSIKDGGDEASPAAETLDRRGEDRRVTLGTRPVRLTQGWLCFDREGERRRLQPIPDAWSTLPDAELVRYLDLARVAPNRKRTDAPARAGAHDPTTGR